MNTQQLVESMLYIILLNIYVSRSQNKLSRELSNLSDLTNPRQDATIFLFEQYIAKSITCSQLLFTKYICNNFKEPNHINNKTIS